MDPEKVSVDLNWDIPKPIRDVQYFLRIANYYWWFIEGYSCRCNSLFNLLKTMGKDNDSFIDLATSNPPVKKGTNKAPIKWTPLCQQVLDELKVHFCSAPVPKHFDPAVETIVETDASNYIVSSILAQRHSDSAKVNGRSTFHAVAFLSE